MYRKVMIDKNNLFDSLSDVEMTFSFPLTNDDVARCNSNNE